MTNPTKGTTGGGSATANNAKNAANQAKNDANAKKVAENKAKVEANRLKVEANRAKVNSNSKKPASAPGKGVTNLPMVTVTAKRSTTLPEVKVTASKKVMSKDPYKYFMGPTDMSKPTKEVTRATYEKGGMPRVKILATDTAKINNLTRSRGNMSAKGYTPLMTKTTPAKKMK